MRMNLASIELKLFVVFDAVMTERSVTRAANRLGMSQPAVSSALNRLRELLGDQIFLRTRDGMVPTPRAEELAFPIQCALRQLESALEPTAFRPEDSEWTFDLGMSDHASVVMLPRLIEHMNEVAPRTKLHLWSKRNAEVPEALDSSEVDIALGVISDLPARFSRSALFADRYVCMMRRGHPLSGRPITREEFEAADHLAVKPGSMETSWADKMLQRYGVGRRTMTTVHQFLAAPGVIERSDMIALVFEKMAGVFDADRFHFCPVPVPEMDVRVDLVWNRARTNHPAHRWLRRQITEAAARLGTVSDDGR